MLKASFFLRWLALLLFSSGGAVTASDIYTNIYVAPDSKNCLESDCKYTFKTIQEALFFSRQLKINSKSHIPIRIILLGDIVIDETINFLSIDSGTKEYPLIIESVGQKKTISSAIKFHQSYFWVGVTRKLNIDFKVQQVWRDNKPLNLARTPNKGNFFYINDTIYSPPQRNQYRFGTEIYNKNSTHILLPQDAQLYLNNLKYPSDIPHLAFIHSWAESRHVISDFSQNRVTISPMSRWPMLYFKKSQELYFEGSKNDFDNIDEFYQDNDGDLYFKNAKTSHVLNIPKLNILLSLTGNNEHNIQYVKFKNLKFMYTKQQRVPHVDNQAAHTKSAAIEVDFANNIVFDNCTFSRLGGYGVWFRKGVTHSQVVQSDFSLMGAGAFRIGENIPHQKALHTTSYNKFSYNIVSNTGLEFPDAVAVMIGQSSHNMINNNYINNTSYTGISSGWTWGKRESGAFENRIENNYLENIGSGLLDDLAAIYNLGPSFGTVISDNYIENVTSSSKIGVGAWGIYLDEGSSGVLVQNNIVYKTASGGFHIHYGEMNTIRNNIFVDGVAAELRRSRNDTGKIIVENNIMVGSINRPTFLGYWNVDGGGNCVVEYQDVKSLEFIKALAEKQNLPIDVVNKALIGKYVLLDSSNKEKTLIMNTCMDK